MRIFGAIAFALLLVVGCSSNKDKDEESKVAKLVDFDSTVDVKRLWSTGTGEGKGRKYLRLVPAIEGDRIFTTDADGEVSAWDRENGKRVWRTKLDRHVTGGVGAGPGVVVVGTVDGEVVALNADDGGLRWSAFTSSEILAPPATDGSVVVAQTVDARVFAFEASDGAQRWTYDHLTPVLSLRGTAAPILTITQAVVAFDNGQIVSFSINDGARSWEARVAQPKGKTDLERIVDVDGTPVEQGGLIYAASYQGNIMALGRAQGNPIWRKPFSTYNRLSVQAGRVYGVSDRSRVTAFQAANGDQLWQNEQLLNRELGPAASWGQYVVAVDKDDHAHVLNQSDGSFAHRFKPKGDGFRTPPQVVGDTLYLMSDEGVLSAYTLEPR